MKKNISNSFIHYGAEVSLFSGKTRAYLRYKKILFIEELSTADVVKNVIYPNTGVRMIPVVKTPEGEYLQDTTHIIDTLESRFPENSIYPDSALQRFLALYLELYADEWLLIPAMSFRWQYKRSNLAFIMKEFGGVLKPNWWKIFQPIAGLLPALYFGRLYKPVLGVSKKNVPEIEKWYEDFLRSFDAHLENCDYLFGNKPSIADFGFIGPLYAHLYRDPYPGKIMREIAPNVTQWVERVQNGAPASGDFLANNQVPETLLPFLNHMRDTYVPVLQETVNRVAKRIDKNPNKRLPRFLGKTIYTLGNVTESRYINTYAQWMLQRPLSFFESVTPDEQAQIREWLTNHNLDSLLDFDITHKIERRDNKLFSADAEWFQ